MSGLLAKAQKALNTITSGDPVLSVHKSVAADTLWPKTIDKEADQAASILRSFFVDGFIVPYRTIGYCPREVLKSCRGLAVFHVLREGIASPSDNGSGILVSKNADGNWSPPSGILIDIGPSFPADVDVLDVMLVIKDQAALDAFATGTIALGDAFSVSSGPIPESEAGAVSGDAKHDKNAAVWSYTKSKAELVDCNLKGWAIKEASGANARFYGADDVQASEILKGNVKAPTGVDNYLAHTLEALGKPGDDYGRLPKAGGSPGDKRVKEKGSDGK